MTDNTDTTAQAIAEAMAHEFGAWLNNNGHLIVDAVREGISHGIDVNMPTARQILDSIEGAIAQGFRDHWRA